MKTDRTLFRSGGRLEQMDTAFYRRDLLPVRAIIKGPAIILQTDSTTVVPPEWNIAADGHGNLIMKAKGAQ